MVDAGGMDRLKFIGERDCRVNGIFGDEDKVSRKVAKPLS